MLQKWFQTTKGLVHAVTLPTLMEFPHKKMITQTTIHVLHRCYS